MGNFWLQWLQRQIRGSSAAVELGALEVVLEEARVVDLERLLLLELEEAWLSGVAAAMVSEDACRRQDSGRLGYLYLV